ALNASRFLNWLSHPGPGAHRGILESQCSEAPRASQVPPQSQKDVVTRVEIDQVDAEITNRHLVPAILVAVVAMDAGREEVQHLAAQRFVGHSVLVDGVAGQRRL